jgi:hypothetical protein
MLDKLSLQKKQILTICWCSFAKKIFFTIFVFALLNWPLNITAISAQQVVINEIAWAGTKTNLAPSHLWWQYEWIELYNNSAETIDLTNWRIEAAQSKDSALIISNGVIEPYGYFVICKKEMEFCHYVHSKLSFNNSYDKNGAVVLKDASLSVIDATPIPSGAFWPKGKNQTKQTMERVNPQHNGQDVSNWQTSAFENGTPGKMNSQPESQVSEITNVLAASTTSQINKDDNKEENLSAQVSFSLQEQNNKSRDYKNIFINEIMPAPLGTDSENEWIELYNNNDFEVSLAGWQIKDQTGAITRYNFPASAKIAPQGFLVVSRKESKITLNNSADGIELLDMLGTIKDSVSYSKAPKGKSWSKIGASWQWSAVPTPGQKNIITNTTQSQTPSSTPENQLLMAQTTKTVFPKQITSQQNNLPLVSKKKLPALIVALMIALASSFIAWQIKKRSVL